MRFRPLKIIIISLLVFVFLNNFITTCFASEQDQFISIDTTKTNYNFLKKEQIGNQIIMYYDIYITLKNSGNSTSDDITLDVTDDGNYPFFQNHTFSPGEDKTFIMEDWIFEGNGVHNITISYYPTNQTRTNAHNSGSMVLYLYENNPQQNNSSTPGFEVFLIFCAIIFLAVSTKFKKI
ncbi:MAG: hypothetical protein JXA91_00050 [Candidatus Thermoplasmatota archaeon]|nr:hypothetical protein [Candidatus Thermoplasmatota archaeon]